ncbi:(Fe-S)-binding protein [Lysobacter korlensis]|uniref:Glycolate oxidase iron-sulfur subunit n=1 Tax=Lysobacter korlensis TaxID=553636 RepID=A0ABV6RLK3_9GAMM
MPEPVTSVDPLVALADRCVQCGLCLPACPTYRHDGLESESPRGRIALARAWALDTVDPTPAGDVHLDHCLGCRSCESVCPAGVEFGALLVEARVSQRLRRPPPVRQRVIEAVGRHPRLLSAGLATYRRLFAALPARMRRLPRPPAPSTTLPAPPSDETVAVFVGCVANSYEPPARDALQRLCAAIGVSLVIPAGQHCCGALHAHAGDRAAAETMGSANRAAFARASTVLTLATGCHDSVRHALTGHQTVVDALDYLATQSHRLRFRERRERVALHLPCTQRNVVRSVPALRRLLAQVPGLEVVELDAGYGCCGAAGLQMITGPERAASYREPLIDQLHASGATRLLSANIGCRLHLAGASTVPVEHPLELLASALAH